MFNTWNHGQISNLIKFGPNWKFQISYWNLKNFLNESCESHQTKHFSCSPLLLIQSGRVRFWQTSLNSNSNLSQNRLKWYFGQNSKIFNRTSKSVKSKVADLHFLNNFHVLSSSQFWVEEVQIQKGVFETLELWIQIQVQILEIDSNLLILDMFPDITNIFYVQTFLRSVQNFGETRVAIFVNSQRLVMSVRDARRERVRRWRRRAPAARCGSRHRRRACASDVPRRGEHAERGGEDRRALARWQQPRHAARACAAVRRSEREAQWSSALVRRSPQSLSRVRTATHAYLSIWATSASSCAWTRSAWPLMARRSRARSCLRGRAAVRACPWSAEQLTSSATLSSLCSPIKGGHCIGARLLLRFHRRRRRFELHRAVASRFRPTTAPIECVASFPIFVWSSRASSSSSSTTGAPTPPRRSSAVIRLPPPATVEPPPSRQASLVSSPWTPLSFPPLSPSSRARARPNCRRRRAPSPGTPLEKKPNFQGSICKSAMNFLIFSI